MQELSTTEAPASIGPFSQGVVDDGTVYVSGQGPVDPATDEIIDGDIQAQTEQTLENIAAVLNAAGASLNDVVKSTVFVMDMEEYDQINKVYGEYMNEPFPARSAVQVACLPIDIGVEIEVIASL